MTPASTKVRLTGGTATLNLANTGGAVDGQVDVFSLLGTSGRIPPPRLPADGEDYAVIDLKSFGARLVDIGGGQYAIQYAIQFAVNTFGTRAHPSYPAEFDVYLDTDRDGTSDYVIYNLELGGFGVTGQNVVRVYNLKTNANGIYFFTDADLDSSGAILTAPLSALGMTPSSQVDVSVQACDNYFTGTCTDEIAGGTYTPGTPRYYADNATPAVPAGVSATLSITALAGGDIASPAQKGLLLVYRDAREQRQADAIFVTP